MLARDARCSGMARLLLVVELCSDRLEGPWLAATLDLPKDFAKIPRDHSQADVLASVPGTQEATDAVLLAQVPRRATVDRKLVTRRRRSSAMR